MLSNKKELVDFFYQFINILESNNLWYFVEAGTLLGTIRESKMIEWDDDIDISISIDTYFFLKDNFPNNFLDFSKEGYPFIFAKWVPDIDNYLYSPIAIDLFPLIPTTKKKMKKYKSLLWKIKFANQSLNKGSKYIGFDWKLKLLKAILWPFQWTTKKITFHDLIEKIYEKDQPEFVLSIENPASKISMEKEPLSVLLKRKKKSFEFFDVYVPQDFDEILISKYGKSYMIPYKGKKGFEHINAINTKLVKY